MTVAIYCYLKCINVRLLDFEKRREVDESSNRQRLTSIFEHLRNTEKSVGHVMETSSNTEHICNTYLVPPGKIKKKPSK